MKRLSNSKALYNFTKQQKLKDSISTKEKEDSLDNNEILTD